MKLKCALLAAAALLALPAAALAHPPGYYEQQLEHLQDHAEHGNIHEEIDEAHAEAHARGFSSPEAHAEYHEGLQELHGQFHEEHPGTWHDHAFAGRGGYYTNSGYGSGYRRHSARRRVVYGYYGY